MEINLHAVRSKDMILSELACALTDHSTYEFGSSHFVDLTEGNITFIQNEYMIDDVTPEELAKYHDWEQDCIRIYSEHDLIAMEPIHSSRSFQIMESFVDTCSPDQQQKLIKALNRRRPFANFRYAVEDLGILQKLYDFKNEAEAHLAEEWLEDEGLAIIDSKIVRQKNKDTTTRKSII